MATRNKIQTQLDDAEYGEFKELIKATGLYEAEALRAIVQLYLRSTREAKEKALNHIYGPLVKQSQVACILDDYFDGLDDSFFDDLEEKD